MPAIPAALAENAMSRISVPVMAAWPSVRRWDRTLMSVAVAQTCKRAHEAQAAGRAYSALQNTVRCWLFGVAMIRSPEDSIVVRPPVFCQVSAP